MRTNLLDGRSTSSSECASLNTLIKEGVRSERTSFQNPLKTEATTFSEIIRKAIALSEYGQRSNFLSSHKVFSILSTYGFSNVLLHLPKRIKSQQNNPYPSQTAPHISLSGQGANSDNTN